MALLLLSLSEGAANDLGHLRIRLCQQWLIFIFNSGTKKITIFVQVKFAQPSVNCMLMYK